MNGSDAIDSGPETLHAGSDETKERDWLAMRIYSDRIAYTVEPEDPNELYKKFQHDAFVAIFAADIFMKERDLYYEEKREIILSSASGDSPDSSAANSGCGEGSSGVRDEHDGDQERPDEYGPKD